jgi:hypothetical protein
MPRPVRYFVTDPRAPRKVIDADIQKLAEEIARFLRVVTPRGATGTLERGWYVTTDKVPPGWGVRVVRNDTPYAKYVEYGTSHNRAQPVLGRTIASYRRRLR